MKNLLMRILITFVVVAIVAGAAYFYTKFQFNTVIVDNPTDAEISVKIDSGEEFKIAAKASVKQKIADGEHEVFVNGESVGKFDKKYSMDAALSYFGKSAILNPTLDLMKRLQILSQCDLAVEAKQLLRKKSGILRIMRKNIQKIL